MFVCTTHFIWLHLIFHLSHLTPASSSHYCHCQQTLRTHIWALIIKTNTMYVHKAWQRQQIKNTQLLTANSVSPNKIKIKSEIQSVKNRLHTNYALLRVAIHQAKFSKLLQVPVAACCRCWVWCCREGEYLPSRNGRTSATKKHAHLSTYFPLYIYISAHHAFTIAVVAMGS